MAIPQPEQDTILMREHAFKNSRDLGIILSPEPKSFQPIKKAGLGTFNYKLVDLKSVDSSTILGESPRGSIQMYKFFSVLTISIFLLVLFYKAFQKYKTQNYSTRIKEKVDDDIEQQSFVYNELGLPQLISTPSSASLVSSFPDTPNASLIGLHILPNNSTDEKFAINVV